MKTRILFISLIIPLFTMSLSASNVKMREEIKYTETSIIREVIIFEQGSYTPQKKATFEENQNKQQLSKIIYLWNVDMGWIPFQKYEYKYLSVQAKDLNSLNYRLWDRKKNNWGEPKVINY